jgi:hypothetical protein
MCGMHVQTQIGGTAATGGAAGRQTLHRTSEFSDKPFIEQSVRLAYHLRWNFQYSPAYAYSSNPRFSGDKRGGDSGNLGSDLFAIR